MYQDILNVLNLRESCDVVMVETKNFLEKYIQIKICREKQGETKNNNNNPRVWDRREIMGSLTVMHSTVNS
jgi:hypothetical protein